MSQDITITITNPTPALLAFLAGLPAQIEATVAAQDPAAAQEPAQEAEPTPPAQPVARKKRAPKAEQPVEPPAGKSIELKDLAAAPTEDLFSAPPAAATLVVEEDDPTLRPEAEQKAEQKALKAELLPEDQKIYTKAEVRALLVQYAEKHGEQKCLRLLNEVGATTLGTVPVSEYATLVSLIEKEL